MAQFDIFENPNRAAGRAFPYLIALQSDISTGGRTVLVAPLAKRTTSTVVDRLTIPVQFRDEDYIVVISAMVAFPKDSVGRPLGAAPDVRDALPRAIDYLFLGL